MNAMAQEVPQAAAITGVLRSVGARFAFVFGSRARGETHRDSDTDIAAFFGAQAPQAYEVLVPPGVDLLVLDDAPEDRVAWLARTRKIYADERYRFERAHREFAHAVIAWRHDR